jgi:hypothetical protein
LFAQRGVTAEEFERITQKRLLRDLRRVRKAVKKSGKTVRKLRDLERQKPTEKVESSAADHSCALMVGQDATEKAEEYHRLEAFWAWHADALRRARAGEEDVVFPPGTYKAAKKYGCKVAEMRYFGAPVRRRDRGQLPEKYSRRLENEASRVSVLLE